jgi:transglutaminase-like putative cysteine protease
MRITVAHSTVYRYSQAVSLEPHLLRLRPRHDATQNLLRHSLTIHPAPGGRTACLDQDGNAAEQIWFDKPLSELSIASSFEVETLRANPFDFLLTRRESFTLPFVYPEPLNSALAPYLAGASEAGAVREFACSVAGQAGWRTLDFLMGLTTTLFNATSHVLRDTGAPNPPELTLAERSGSCRDLAVLFCAVCRSMGVPARFVSGYECGATSIEHAYLHAWAEVYLEGGGWRGYDPSRGLAVSSIHVPVAAAADPQLAAPVSGTYRGSAGSQMDFSISIQTQGE